MSFLRVLPGGFADFLFHNNTGILLACIFILLILSIVVIPLLDHKDSIIEWIAKIFKK